MRLSLYQLRDSLEYAYTRAKNYRLSVEVFDTDHDKLQQVDKLIAILDAANVITKELVKRERGDVNEH